MATKPGRKLRFCIDFRKLNNVTKKDQSSLFLIKEILDCLDQAKIFTKIDIRQVFYYI